MRSLQAAALLALPVFAGAIATSSPTNPIAYSELVTLPLAVGEDGFEIVALRLNVHADTVPCDPSVISINGNTLSQDGMKSGSGPLTLEDGLVVTAKWHFTCDYPSQFLDMTILTFDGDKIPHVSFTTHFFYDAESHADKVTVGQPQVNDAPTAEYDADALRELRHKDLQAELDRLEELRAKATELGEKIEGEGEESVDLPTTEDFVEESAASIKDCDTSRCMWQVIKAKVKAAASDLREKVLGPHELSDGIETGVQAGINAHEQPLTDGFASQQAPSEHRPSLFNNQEIASSESPREALLSALFLALFAFSLFTLFSLLYTHRERIRTALAERRARRRDRRLRSRAERRAARAARKEAIRNFICGLFRSLMDFDAEKRAAEDERRQALAQRQAEEGRREIQTEESTSMEQELAGLRVAAAMVDDLVSGRRPLMQNRVEDQQQEPQPPPVPPRPRMAGFVTYEDRLPTYEEQVHDSAVVADGFRFESGLGATEDHQLPVPDRTSDRLGYNK